MRRETSKSLLLEITHLRPLLQEVDKRIRRNSSLGWADGLHEFKEPLTRLNELMERLAHNLAPDGITKVSNRLAWPLWGKKDAEEGLNTIERFKTLLSTWLTMDIGDSAQGRVNICITAHTDSNWSDIAGEQRLDHEYMIRTLKQSAQENEQAHDHMISALTEATEEHRIEHSYISKSVRDVARKQDSYHESAERDRIIEWYSPLNFFLRQADIFNSRQPGTGQWLLEHDAFKKWKSGSGNMIWCRGMPGAGKTVLVSIVVDNLRTELESRNVGVAVIYLNHKETDAHSPSKLLASLWRQLVFRKPIWSAVHQLYEKHHEPHTRPSLDEDQAVLCSIIAEYSKVFIFVDALDEYPEMQRDVLLRLLSTLGPGVNLLVTFRPHVAMEHVTSFEPLEIQAREDDIQKYLEGQILKSSRLSKHIQNSPDLREAIEAKIIQRSDGMFLLAKLHIDSLATKLSVKGVRDALSSLPRDLSSTFDEVVHRINRQSEEERALAWLVLSWVTNARRPLEPSELRVALAVEEGSTKFNTENLLDTETILSVCAGLVVINREDNRVRLIHYTIQDYLERIQDREFPHANTKITAACITYLLFDTLPRRDIGHALSTHLLSTHPLLDYAVNYTLIHAHGKPEYEIKQTILSFLNQCSGWLELWNWSHRLERIPSTGTRVWIAAFFDLREITGCVITEDGVQGHAVYMAIVRGSWDVAHILVGDRPYIQALGEYYASALQFAISKGKEETLRLLLEHSAGDLDVPGGPYERAVQTAVSEGHLAMAKLLIEHDINIKWAGTLRSKLLASCEEIARLLIKYGIDEAGGWRSSGLKAASLVGCESTTRILIESGADVNAKNNVKSTQGAAGEESDSSSGGFLRVPDNSGQPAPGQRADTLNVKKLPPLWGGGGLTMECLEGYLWEVFGACDGFRRVTFSPAITGPMCSVQFEDGQYATKALRRLSGEIKGGGMRLSYGSKNWRRTRAKAGRKHGESAVTKGRGASPKSINNLGSALHAASSQGHEAIVRLLIEHGAVIDSDALRIAAAAGHVQLVRLFIEHGPAASVMNATGALRAASSAGHQAIFELLLEKLDRTSRDSQLREACEKGEEQLVRMLIEHGADINSINALCAASSRGHEQIVRLFIQHGADINSTDALEGASCAGHDMIVRLLLEHGADVNSPTSLFMASAYGYEHTVRLLLEHGADINSTTALEAASRRGHEQIVRLLIEHGADINSTNALKAASFVGHGRIVRLLVEHGADINSTIALEDASREGHEQIVRLLIEHGADVKSSNALNAAVSSPWENVEIVRLLIAHGAEVTSAALETAASRGCERIVRLFIEHGADLTSAALEAVSSGRSVRVVRLLIEHCVCVNSTAVLKTASSRGYGEIVRLLIEHGAVIKSTDVLHEIYLSGHDHIVRLIVEKRADINSIDVLRAACESHEGIVHLLLEHGADVNNCTAVLDTASFWGRERTVRLLIQHGADINSTTALETASRQGHEQIVRLLIQHGADINSTHALQAAAKKGHEQIVRLLIEHGAEINATNALAETSSVGHEKIVHMLQEQIVDHTMAPGTSTHRSRVSESHDDSILRPSKRARKNTDPESSSIISVHGDAQTDLDMTVRF
ncbi:ankyrin repeat-containing domain protein [Mycena epipterygia]|nr:ankyrin repeat-containing domain protein [Mycena epipterygia]